jgi:hypothetical protein
MTKYKSKTNDRKKKSIFTCARIWTYLKIIKTIEKKQYKIYETEKKNIKIIVFTKKIMLKSLHIYKTQGPNSLCDYWYVSVILGENINYSITSLVLKQLTRKAFVKNNLIAFR